MGFADWSCIHIKSNIKHMEEIREAGLEMPDVNQVEVSMGTLYCYWESALIRPPIAPSAVSAEAHRGLLQTA